MKIQVLVQPKASKNEIVGMLDNHLKIRTTAPPIDGKANEAVIKLLAKHFSCRKSEVTLISGTNCRKKVFEILTKS